MTTREDLHDPFDLCGTTDNRVELAILRLLGQVSAELLQHAVTALTRWIESGATGHDWRLPHDIIHGRADVIRRDAHALEHVHRRAIPLASDAQ